MSPPSQDVPSDRNRPRGGGGGGDAGSNNTGGLPISDNNVSTTASDGILDAPSGNVADWAEIGETDDINVSAIWNVIVAACLTLSFCRWQWQLRLESVLTTLTEIPG